MGTYPVAQSFLTICTHNVWEEAKEAKSKTEVLCRCSLNDHAMWLCGGLLCMSKTLWRGCEGHFRTRTVPKQETKSAETYNSFFFSYSSFGQSFHVIQTKNGIIWLKHHNVIVGWTFVMFTYALRSQDIYLLMQTYGYCEDLLGMGCACCCLSKKKKKGVFCGVKLWCEHI